MTFSPGQLLFVLLNDFLPLCENTRALERLRVPRRPLPLPCAPEATGSSSITTPPMHRTWTALSFD